MKTALLALFLLVAAAVAQAQTVAPAAQAAAKHANGEHPAVLMARQPQGAIDPNRFIVAPPASTRWTSGPAVTVPAVQTATASAR
jgi:hypothetical protein